MRLLLGEDVTWQLVAYSRPYCEAVLHVQDTRLLQHPHEAWYLYQSYAGVCKFSGIMPGLLNHEFAAAFHRFLIVDYFSN